MRWSPIVIILISWSLLTCDSTGSIEDPLKTRFVKYYGNDGDQTGKDMVQLPDGSIMLFGTTRPSGQGATSQWYLVKVNAEGEQQWAYEFGGPLDDEASDIEISGPNEIVLVGNTYQSATDRDIHIMRVSFDGILISPGGETIYTGFPAGSDEDASSIFITSDGFIVAGSTNNTAGSPDIRDELHLRFYTDLSLTYPISWEYQHSQGNYDAGVKIIPAVPEDPLAKYYMLGYSDKVSISPTAGPGFNFWVYPLDDNGDGIWGDDEGSIGDIGDEKLFDGAYSKVVNGYLLTGITTNNATLTTDVYVAKVVVQVTPLPTPSYFLNVTVKKPLSYSLGTSVTLAGSTFAGGNGGYFILTSEQSVASDQNWLLTKIDDSGTVAGPYPIIFGGEGMDTCGAIQELPDGRIIMIGTMRTGRPDAGETKMTLVKVNSQGKFEK